METKIIFLIIIILCMYLLFSKAGGEWLEYYVGIKKAPTKGTVNNETLKKSEKYSGDYGKGGVV